MGYDNTSITVNAVGRTYTKGFVAKYAKELAKGNTVICRTDITDGQSILRISHEESGGVARHLVSLEDNTSAHEVKAHLVIACPAGDPTAETAAENLALGLMSWLDDAGIITGVVDGDL